MKYIKKLLSTRPVDGATQYTYLIGNTDSFDEHEATAIQKFAVGEKVRTWFKPEFNRGVVGRLCQKCLQPVPNQKALSSPQHEFCQIKRAWHTLYECAMMIIER